jgi:hypothetical protein
MMFIQVVLPSHPLLNSHNAIFSSPQILSSPPFHPNNSSSPPLLLSVVTVTGDVHPNHSSSQFGIFASNLGNHTRPSEGFIKEGEREGGGTWQGVP